MRVPGLVCGLLVLLLAAPLTDGFAAEPSLPRTERWYEIFRRGEKLGHSRVVWAPSTWESRKTLHDTTTITEKSVRNMLGLREVFELVMTIDLERDVDGTLWWMRTVVEEAGRTSVDELTWTGKGYESVSRLEGQEQRVFVPLDAPVMTDAEAFLSARIRAGEVKVGDRFDMRLLDVRARKARVIPVEILAREEVEDGGREPAVEGEAPPAIPCFKVRETDPETGSQSTMWIDEDGAFVRLVTDNGQAYRRVRREQAETAPVRPAESRITVPSYPVLERIMSADRQDLDLHLQGDAERALPAFPDSPWSRVTGRRGNDDEGWVFEMELRRHDAPAVDTTLPLAEPERFERELEATVLMPCRHENVQAITREIVGDTTSAREAAHRLARWVYENLEKASPAVGQASALEILDSRQGDCSEHAVLFVALCRAAGIPARQCSGYVCVGSDWGAHAWAEIWTGEWIGADPTTGEIGCAARYVFFGYPDRPDSYPGVVSARASGRMRFVTTRIVEGDDDYPLEDVEAWHIHDKEAKRYVHVLAGIEARDPPRAWVVRMFGTKGARVKAPGLDVRIEATADQGATLGSFGPMSGGSRRFAGLPALGSLRPGRGAFFLVHSRRRLIQISVRGENASAALPEIERVFAATFEDPPRRPTPQDEPPAEATDDTSSEERDR